MTVPTAARTRPRVVVGAVLAVALVAAVVVGALRFDVLRTVSGSMAPTVGVGDVVVVDRASGAPARGDVVVLDDPGGWAERVARLTSTPDVPGVFVKRVVGLPGERVACCDAAGRLTVDGEPVDEPYRAEGALASVLAFDRLVPPGELFVLGDARGVSVDSRYLGTVPTTAVVGRVVAVVPLP